MTRYILTLPIAALGLAYYMCLLPSLHLMPDSLLLAILPTVGLHITLQRLDVTKAYHICVLIISAIFSAFYRLLDSDSACTGTGSHLLHVTGTADKGRNAWLHYISQTGYRPK